MSYHASAVRTDELLVTAATRGEYDRVKEYLDHGAVSAARNHHLLTALHWSVTMGHLDVTQVCPPSSLDRCTRHRDHVQLRWIVAAGRARR